MNAAFHVVNVRVVSRPHILRTFLPAGLSELRHQTPHQHVSLRMESNAHLAAPPSLEVPPGATADVRGSERPPMGSLIDSKRALRKIVRSELRGMSVEQRAEEDEAIQRHVATSDWFQSSKRICAYISCAPLREVATNMIVPQALEQGVVYLPRVEDKSSNMRMLRVINLEGDLVGNAMNIMEPTPDMPDGSTREDLLDATEPLDLVLMPGLAFDRNGGRLGRGGGYYDLFIQRLFHKCDTRGWTRPKLVGLSYTTQVRHHTIPMDESDKRLDALVTANGVVQMDIIAFPKKYMSDIKS